MKKKFLLLFVFGLAMLTGCYSDESTESIKESKGLKFKMNETCDGYIVVGKGLCNDENIYIPSTHKNLSVTGIGSYAFDNCKSLISITIPSSVTSIGDNAFNNCKSLSSIILPSSVNSIGWSAFKGCISLQYNEYENGFYLGNDDNPYVALVKTKNSSITNTSISNSTKVIIRDAFEGLSSSQYNEYGNGLYIGNENNPYFVLVKAKDTSISKAFIPNNTKFIMDSAFLGCSSLTSIEIPNGVTSIESSVFSGCSSLTTIEMPNSVTRIERDAFHNCSSLTSIEIPNSVTKIGIASFYGCNSLTSITIPNGITSIGWGSFYDCNSLTSITIPNSVTSIEYGAFYGCGSLTIYCELTRKPRGWDLDWNNSNRPVYWSKKWSYVDGVPTTI